MAFVPPSAQCIKSTLALRQAAATATAAVMITTTTTTATTATAAAVTAAANATITATTSVLAASAALNTLAAASISTIAAIPLDDEDENISLTPPYPPNPDTCNHPALLLLDALTAAANPPTYQLRERERVMFEGVDLSVYHAMSRLEGMVFGGRTPMERFLLGGGGVGRAAEARMRRRGECRRRNEGRV